MEWEGGMRMVHLDECGGGGALDVNTSVQQNWFN